MFIDLKPCPFCGNEDIKIIAEIGGVRVKCLKCGCGTQEETDEIEQGMLMKESAIRRVMRAWNWRYEK